MKYENPIEEISRIREETAAECVCDLKRMVQRLREGEAKHPERLVSFATPKATRRVRKKRHTCAK